MHRLGLSCALALLLLAPASAYASGTGYVFVSNEQSNDIAVLDPKSDYAVVARIATGRRPRDMHFTKDRQRLLVACGDDDEIDVIDVAALKVIDRIKTGSSPEIFLLSPDERTLFVSDEEDSSVEAIDVEDKKIEREIQTGPEPEGLALGGGILYATSEMADVVHVIDPAAGRVTTSIVVGSRPRRLLLRPEAHELWVSDEMSGDIALIDTKADRLLRMVTFDPPGFRRIDVTPVGLALSHDRKLAFITLGRANHVAFVDPETKAVLAYVLVGSRAWGVAVSHDDKTLFVTNGLSDDLTIIDIASRTAIKSVAVGRTPHSVVVDD